MFLGCLVFLPYFFRGGRYFLVVFGGAHELALELFFRHFPEGADGHAGEVEVFQESGAVTVEGGQDGAVDFLVNEGVADDAAHAFEFVAEQFALHQVFNDVFFRQGELFVEFGTLFGVLGRELRADGHEPHADFIGRDRATVDGGRYPVDDALGLHAGGRRFVRGDALGFVRTHRFSSFIPVELNGPGKGGPGIHDALRLCR